MSTKTVRLNRKEYCAIDDAVNELVPKLRAARAAGEWWGEELEEERETLWRRAKNFRSTESKWEDIMRFQMHALEEFDIPKVEVNAAIWSALCDASDMLRNMRFLKEGGGLSEPRWQAQLQAMMKRLSDAGDGTEDYAGSTTEADRVVNAMYAALEAYVTPVADASATGVLRWEGDAQSREDLIELARKFTHYETCVWNDDRWYVFGHSEMSEADAEVVVAKHLEKGNV